MYNEYRMGYVPYALQNVFSGTMTPSAVKNNSYAYAFNKQFKAPLIAPNTHLLAIGILYNVPRFAY